MPYEVAERAGHVEVSGASGDDVLEALGLLERIRELQAHQTATTRPMLVQALMATDQGLTPPATLAQAQRLAAERDLLLTTPVFTYATLGQVRGDRRESATRTFVARRRAEGDMFTVHHRGKTLIPAFQLQADGAVRPELGRLLKPLLAVGVDGWTLWAWLTSPSSLLSGETPQVVAGVDPDRAEHAARRFAEPPAA